MAVVGVAAAVAALGACGDDDGAQTERQREVAARGAEVLPFDLDATTHHFEERDADGAVIECSTADPGLVTALHAWAAAQVSDHGDHADGG